MRMRYYNYYYCYHYYYCYYHLYVNIWFLGPLGKDSRTPGACGVLLQPWVDPSWYRGWPEGFLIFQICAFTVYFCKRSVSLAQLPMAMK